VTRYAFDGENFMTPEVIYIKKLASGLAVELSRGTGFDHSPLFGVTFSVFRDGRWQRTYAGTVGTVPGPESKCLHSRAAAEAYILEVTP
jgi:hypothetical protein